MRKRSKNKTAREAYEEGLSRKLLSASFDLFSKDIDEMIEGLNSKECSTMAKEELMTLMLRVLDANKHCGKDYIKGLLIVCVLRLRSELKGTTAFAT